MLYEYLATIQGGAGPDEWTCELTFKAGDFLEAANLAHERAEDFRGAVTSLDRTPTSPCARTEYLPQNGEIRDAG